MRERRIIGMEHIARSEFSRRFPRPEPSKQFDDACDTLIAENDVIIAGIIQNVVVRSGIRAIISGLVEKSLIVEHGAIVYVDGLIDGRAEIDGAVCIEGHIVGRMSGNGIVFDCSEPGIEGTVTV